MPRVALLETRGPSSSSFAREPARPGPEIPKRTSTAALRSVGPLEHPLPTTAPAARRNDTSTPARGSDAHSPALMTYFRDVRLHPLLSRDEEHRIAVAWVKTGDARLANRLVAANLRLVVKIALEYRAARRNLLDLIQEGNVGLIHAVNKYDPNRGVKVSSYASWWIRAYILKFIMSNARLVKVGTTQSQRRIFFGLRRERARLEGNDGCAAEPRQLAAAFGVSEKTIIEMDQRLSSLDTSLDGPSIDDGDRSRGDMLSAEASSRPDVQSETRDFRAALRRALDTFRLTLEGRDLEIFDGRLVAEDEVTLAEIATRFGVSRERVRQIEARLKERLRRYLRESLGPAVSMAAA